jgi:putative aldouronate transport system substrate-binding protein
MSHSMSRRSLFRVAGASAAAAAFAPVLSACGSGATAKVSNTGVSLAPWPTYIPNPAEPNYALPALPNNGTPGALSYPPLPLVSSVAEVPGDGSVVTALAFSYGDPVSLGSSNKMLAAINKAMNVQWQPNFVVESSGSSYTTAVTTAQASGNLPDLIAVAGLPDQSQFIEEAYADLTPYLSGNAIKDYPNLASIPPRGWELMGRINGKIYGVPLYRYNAPGQGLECDQAKFQAAGIWPTEGLTVNQLAAGLAKINGPGHWALGATPDIPYGYPYHTHSAGVPNNFLLSDGEFTMDFETPEYKVALANMVYLYSKGLFNPDALTASSTEQQDAFENGTWIATFGGLGGLASTYADVGNKFPVSVAYPYNGNGGASPCIAGGDEDFCWTAVKKSSPDRIRMLLRVLDYLFAPFGTKEWELLNEGVQFTRGPDGSPSNPTALGNIENGDNIPFHYLGCQPQPIFFPDQPSITKLIYDTYKTLMPITISDPSAPYQSGSATYSATMSGWDVAINTAVADVVSGKQSLSSWDSTVAQLKSQFKIAQIEKELAQGYAAANA